MKKHGIPLILISWLLFMSLTIGHPIQGENILGGAYRFTADQDYWTQVEDFAVSGEYLYLSYDSKDIIQCFRTNGTYSHSYCFDQSSNGQMLLYLTQEGLYLAAKGYDRYALTDGEVTEYLPFSDGAYREILDQQLPEAQKRTGPDGSIYEMRGVSIWRIFPDGTEREVVHRPLWAWLANPVLWWALMFFPALGLFICKAYTDRQNRRKEK